MTGTRGLVMVTLVALGACKSGSSTPNENVDAASDVPQSTAGTGGASAGASGADGSSSGGSGDAPSSPDAAAQTVVLTLTSADDAPITGIASLLVTLTEDGDTGTTTFPHDPTVPIDAGGLVTLSVRVTTSASGMVTFVVDARDASGCTVATRLISVVLLADPTLHEDVSLLRLEGCATADAGASDVGAPDAGGAFPGCAPANLDCPDEMTCQVDCAAHKNTCTASGTGPHGATCTSNRDCAPGTQCFDYAGSGCAVKVCRHYCDTDVNCPQPLQAVDGKNLCVVPISCPAAPDAYHTCSLACDPTASARANGTTDCPDGLSCLLLDADHADCACPPTTQSKLEGAPCASGAECAPGLVCNLMGGTRVCRALCKCYADGDACSAPGDCPTAGTHCTPLTNGIVNGVCLAN